MILKEVRLPLKSFSATVTAMSKFVHDLQCIIDHFRIKGRGGFIEKHHLWFRALESNDGYPLLLAA
jgi:hypothetical protein